jgi:hypothetical protein
VYNFVHAKGSLKGQCHEIFDFRQFATGIVDNGGKFAKVAAQLFF